MQLKDVMTRDPGCVAPGDAIQDAVRKVCNLDVGPLPICDDDRLAGMITDRDIVVRAVAEGRNPQTTEVSEMMTDDLVQGYDDQAVHEAARMAQE